MFLESPKTFFKRVIGDSRLLYLYIRSEPPLKGCSFVLVSSGAEQSPPGIYVCVCVTSVGVTPFSPDFLDFGFFFIIFQTRCPIHSIRRVNHTERPARLSAARVLQAKSDVF